MTLTGKLIIAALILLVMVIIIQAIILMHLLKRSKFLFLRALLRMRKH